MNRPLLCVLLASVALAGCGDDSSNPVTPPPFVKSFSQAQAWTCPDNTNCQDVFNIQFTAGSAVTFKATDVTGGSIVQLALYAPGTALGGTNLFTNTANEYRCGTVTDCDAMPEGQDVTNFVIAQSGTYRLAVTRDWGESCGGDGTYRLAITSDKGFSTPSRTANDTLSQAPGVECP